MTNSKWFLNDASIQEQFVGNYDEFFDICFGLLKLRKNNPQFGKKFVVTNFLMNPVNENIKNLRNTLFNLKVNKPEEKNIKRGILGWLSKEPFEYPERQCLPSDKFLFGMQDVSQTGLGSATIWKQHGNESFVFSFEGGQVDFTANQLSVEYFESGQHINSYSLDNITKLDSLEKIASNLIQVGSWTEMLEVARTYYTNLVVGDIFKVSNLSGTPFREVVCDDVLNLLSILNNYAEHCNRNGEEGPKAQELREKFFIGKRAKFSDEAEVDKVEFERKLWRTRKNGENYFATWHGKVNQDKFRIYFDWPIKDGNPEKIEIFYIGEKITKH